MRRLIEYGRSGTLAGDLTGGIITGFVSITYGSSYAALLFAGPLERYLAYGISVTLISAILGAVLVALTSSRPYAIAGPDSNTTSVLSAMLAALAAQMGAAGLGEELLPHVMLALFLTTLATGMALYLLGWLRLGYIVRYIPYLGMAGFLAATGWLMTVGALGVILGTPLTLEGAGRLLREGPDAKLVAAVALALVFLFGLKHFRHVLVLPGLLLGSMALVYLGLALAGLDLDSARAQGWLFQGLGEIRLFPPWELPDLRLIHWELLAPRLGEGVATVMVAAITILLVATGLEVATNDELDLDRELRSHGLTNALMAGAGGYIGLLSLVRSLIVFRAGRISRLSGVIVGATCALVLFVSPILVSFLPKIVLGAFLLYLGLSLLHEWLIESWARFEPWEYLLVVLILVVTVLFGFTAGVVVGVMGACLDFAIKYSRFNVIKGDLDATAFRSNSERPPEERQLLERHGRELRILSFRGFIFFGMASRLLERIRRPLAAEGVRTLILDLTDVHGIDISAAMVFLKVCQQAQRGGVTVIMTGLGPRPAAAFAKAGRGDALAAVQRFPQLDQGLEWAENRLIEAYGHNEGYHRPMLDKWLLAEFGDGLAVEYLKAHLDQVILDQGEFLFRQGAPSHTLYLIDTGRIGIMVNVAGGSSRRLVSHIGGTVFGSEDVYTASRRSTSAVAELPSVVYGLPVDRLHRLNADFPELAARFNAMIVRFLALRLHQANEEISLLRREALTRHAVSAA